jgi:hypothetical protein
MRSSCREQSVLSSSSAPRKRDPTRPPPTCDDNFPWSRLLPEGRGCDQHGVPLISRCRIPNDSRPQLGTPLSRRRGPEHARRDSCAHDVPPKVTP